MTAPSSLTYQDAGVDRELAARSVDRIKDLVRTTFTPEVLTDLGTFGALFQPDLSGIAEPVLVSATDGVGTKLKLAFLTGKHDTVGIDLVAMCANDVLAQGARPLFFLDYIASGKLDPEVLHSVLSGIVEGCRRAGCALIGGETAEMPGFYAEGEYDLVGFAVGLADRSRLVDGSRVQAGDVILGLASSGLHSNGYSLARKLLFDVAGCTVDTFLPELGRTVGEELLEPTVIYVRPVLQLFQHVKVKGIAHITGGGFTENIPRAVADGAKAVVHRRAWKEPRIFGLLQRLGGVEWPEMFSTFNMGIGMVLIVDPEDVGRALGLLDGAEAIGEIVDSVEKTCEIREP